MLRTWKGASLAKLFRAGFNVPPGVIVPAAAYAAFIAQSPDLRARIDALPYDDAEELHTACASLREHLLSLPLPSDA